MELPDLLERCAKRHSHLCPRQVLGVRMGLAGLAALHLRSPVSKPTALVIVETDGCFVDGIEVATGATVGHRTLRITDLGKIATTFVDVPTGRAMRLSPQLDARARSRSYAPLARDRYTAQLEGYRVMPDGELFRFQPVVLDPSVATLLSKPDVREICSICGEEIINERELIVQDAVWCRTCVGHGYYATTAEPSRGRRFHAGEIESIIGGPNEPTAEALSAIR
jgi:formylmethanofuran dehydrogenase subunit E